MKTDRPEHGLPPSYSFGFIGIALIAGMAVSFYFFWPLLSGRFFYSMDENFCNQSVKTMIRESFAAFTLPLWNTVSGPGGVPGVLFSSVPWDIRLLAESFLRTQYVLSIEFGLLGLVYTFSIGNLLKLRWQAWAAVVLGFFSFFMLDWVGIFFPVQFLNSAYLAFPLLVALIFDFENRPTAKAGFLISVVYMLSFHGSKIEPDFQLAFFLAFLIPCIRFSKPGSRSFNFRDLLLDPKNKIYLIAVAVGLAVNYWQLEWLHSVIEESGRMTSHWSVEGLLRVPKSLKTSSFLWIFAILVGGQSAVLLTAKGRWNSLKTAWPWLLIPAIFLAVPPYPSLAWFDQDIWLSRLELKAFVAAAILVWFVLSRNLENRNREEQKIFLLEFPALIALVLHFVFEDPHSMNEYANPLEIAPAAIQFVFAFFPSFSLLSPYAWIRRASILSLAALYFIRCHLQVFLMLGGAVWHVQRDSFIYSYFISVLIVLGALVILQKLSSLFPKRQFIGEIIAWSALITLLPFFRSQYFNNEEMFTRQEKKDSLYRFQAMGKLEEFFLAPGRVHPGDSFAISPDTIVPGALASRGINQIEHYDSGLSAPTKRFFAHYPGRRAYRDPASFSEKCRLPFTLFPNNFHRAWDCSFEERSSYYFQNVRPYYEPFSLPLLDLLGIRYVVDTLAPQDRDAHAFSAYATGVFDHDQPEYPIYIWEYLGFSKERTSFVEFYDVDPSTCRGLDYQMGRPIESLTDYRSAPKMKSGFTAEMSVRGPGCLKLKIANSPLWKFYVDGKPVQAESDAFFTFLPIYGSVHRIEGFYFPAFKFLLGFGVLLVLFWLRTGYSISQYLIKHYPSDLSR